MMSFYDYSYAKSQDRQLARGDGYTPPAKSLRSSVTLPLPLNLTDSYGVQIQGTEMGAFGALALDFARGGGTESVLKSAYKSGQRAYNMAETAFSGDVKGVQAALQRGSATNAAQYFLRNTIDSLFEGAGAALSVGNGNAINPHIALTFEGVDLKSYTLSWRLAPKNPDEAEHLRQIINTVRAHSLPQYQSVAGGSTGSLKRGLLKYPSLVQPAFFGIDANHFWHFKPCMIQNIDINYAPEGVAVQAGGKPAVVDLSIQMSETAIHTRDDYDTSSGAFLEIDDRG